MSPVEHEDLWAAIRDLTATTTENGKQIAVLVRLSEQQPLRQLECYKRIGDLETGVDQLESQWDKACGGWGVLHWLLTGGFLAVTGAAIALSAYIRELLLIVEKNHVLLMGLPK